MHEKLPRNLKKVWWSQGGDDEVVSSGLFPNQICFFCMWHQIITTNIIMSRYFTVVSVGLGCVCVCVCGSRPLKTTRGQLHELWLSILASITLLILTDILTNQPTSPTFSVMVQFFSSWCITYKLIKIKWLQVLTIHQFNDQQVSSIDPKWKHAIDQTSMRISSFVRCAFILKSPLAHLSDEHLLQFYISICRVMCEQLTFKS